MAKVYDWAKARALYEAGKSLREISKESGIDNSNISKRAKKEEWSRSILPHIIADAVRVQEEITALSLPQQNVVTAEVARILEAKEFYATNVRKVVRIGINALSKDPSPANSKIMTEAIKNGMIAEGVVPFYAGQSSMVINNTNAQQNTTEKRTLADYYADNADAS